MQTSNITTINSQLAKTNLLPPLMETPVALAPELGSVDKQIVHANRCFPKASECEKDSFVSEINILITKAYLDAGYNIKDGGVDIATMTFTVADDIYREFNSLTIPEIKIAFHKGVRGEYGELKGLSAVVFYNFLKLYFWNTRIEATKKQRKFEAEQEQLAKTWKPTPDEEKIFKYFAVNSLIKSFYNKEVITLDSAGYTYNCLVHLNMLTQNPDAEYQKKIFKQAKSALIEKKSQDIKSTRNPASKATYRAELEDLKNALTSEKGNKIVVTAAKAIYVKDCLKTFCEGKAQKQVMLEVRHKLIGNITDDELIWEAWRLKLKKPNDLFKTQKQHNDFLERTKQLREQKPPRP